MNQNWAVRPGAARRGASDSNFLFPEHCHRGDSLSLPAQSPRAPQPAGCVHLGKSPTLLSLSFLFICKWR